MARIISIHSFRGGAGKSNTTANLAATWAREGRRVGVIDADIASPGIHVVFGLAGDDVGITLNDFLWGDASLPDAAHDVTSALGPKGGDGAVLLVPSSTRAGEITRALREGYDAQRLALGIRALVDDLELDLLLIDTHPGLNEETLLSIVVSHQVVMVVRPDRQDYEGTGVAIEVFEQLDVPDLRLLVNKAPRDLIPEELARQVTDAYGAPCVGVIPHSDDMLGHASDGLFTTSFPHHAISRQYRDIAARLQS